MTITPPIDTNPDAYERQLALIRTLSKPERMRRAPALSALVRKLTWEGATLRAARHGPTAQRQRYLAQLYGPDLTPELRHLLDKL